MSATATMSALGRPATMMDPVPTLRSADLIGRDAELDALRDQLGIGASTAGSGSAVLLGGDAGVGKTRLLTELRDLAVTHGWQVVAGHCLDLADTALPYLPFTEILGRVAAEHPDVVARVLEEHPALGRLQAGRRVRQADGGADDQSLERGDVFDAVHALLEQAAAEAPLLVVVEDTHWADRSTRDMLSFLFGRPYVAPVALVVSYRSDDLHRRHPLRRQLGEWARLPVVERLQLEPLPAAAVRRLVQRLHPDPIREPQVAGIVSRAEGNPFFVEELVGAMWAGGGSVPGDLADVLLARLDRLDDQAREVVRIASVAGRSVSHHLLAQVCDLDPAALEAALRAAVEGNVLVAAGPESYAFRHALLGESVYDDLLPGERVRLHATYAEVLRTGRAPGAAAELAKHARLGQDHHTALLAAIEAGNDAMRVGGPEEAAHHFRQALTLTTDPAVGPLDEVDLPLLVTRATDALIAAGHIGKAAAVVREQLDLLPADAPDASRGQLLTALARALIHLDTEDDPRAVVAEAVALLPAPLTTVRAKALALQARVLAGFGDVEEARQAGLEALGIAQRDDMPRLVTDILTTLVGLDREQRSDEIQHALLDVIDKARDAGAVNSEIRGLYLLGRLHQDRADHDESMETFAQAVAVGAAAGTPWTPFAGVARFMEAAVAHASGRWDAAVQLCRVEGQAPPADYEAMFRALEATIRAARGDRTVADQLAQLRSQWSFEGLVGIWGSSAELELHEQHADVDGALESYDLVVTTLKTTWRELFQARLRLAALTLGVLGTASATLSAGERSSRHADAARLHDDGHRVHAFHREEGVRFGPEAVAWIQRLDAEWLRWRWRAQVEPPDEAELVEAWRETERLFDAYGNVFELARVRARLAGVLRLTGDDAAARTAGDLAREAARALGAQPLLAELTAQGSTGGRIAPASDVLTPREREILALVAEGRTNGEIGKQLFIATKTVSVHVSNILGKLGAASRTEAAALARRRGLLG
jgi:DNA-binding CsgD family transcriptional regulator/tetratricopeptide (TPR) repeat protein